MQNPDTPSKGGNGFGKGYTLLDSGGGRKLEQFGERILIRPTSTAIWSARLSTDEWRRADAIFFPGKGWEGTPSDAPWIVFERGLAFELRLQRNGQIGFFPEHLTYSSKVLSVEEDLSGRSVLNLFAYTGALTCMVAKSGAEVTHVDLSQAALTWAERNRDLNGINRDQVRLIRDDALRFLRREVKRGKRYDLVIADPPSFSRVRKHKQWSLEEIASTLVSDLLEVTERGGKIVLSSHHPVVNYQVFRNLFLDHEDNERRGVIEGDALELRDMSGERVVPSGTVTFYHKTS